MSAFLSPKGYDCVPILQNIVGLLLITVKVNGIEGLFILDTGAGNSVIDTQHASHLLLNLQKESASFTGAGAGGLGIEVDGFGIRDIILPGDGTSLWTITHASDVAAGILGLLHTPDAIGEAVHVTGSEALTWRGIHEAIASAAGVTHAEFAAQCVCVPSDALVAAAPSQMGSIYGDKMHPAVYDTSKLRSLVPGWEPRVRFAEGVAEAIDFFEARPELQTIDAEANAMFDALGARYRAALAASKT